MTYEKALELLNNMEFKHEYQGKDEYGDMLVKIKDALEKQMPKKTITNELELCAYCPNCEYWFDEFPNYCEYCGQRLDWEDE